MCSYHEAEESSKRKELVFLAAKDIFVATLPNFLVRVATGMNESSEIKSQLESSVVLAKKLMALVESDAAAKKKAND